MKVGRREFVKGGVAIGSLSAGAGAIAQAPSATADPMLSNPYVDVDEWRDAPVRHRYVHGGFGGTDARFVMHFPPPELYKGRFYQAISAVPLPEEQAAAVFGSKDAFIGFAFDSGAAAVASNMGGFNATAGPNSQVDPTIAAYRVSAATARFARVLANRMYGAHRTYGYAFGGSGGGYRTLGIAQNTDAFDGVVPFMHPTPAAIPNGFAARVRAQRVLKDKLPQIADALEPGGGDPYAGLDAEERGVLREVTRHGFPIRTWVFHETMGIGALQILYQTVLEKDPSYFTDFWTKPGYLGFDNPKVFDGARVQHVARVTRVVRSNEAARAGLTAPGRMAPRTGDADVAWQTLEKDYGGGALPVAIELDSVPPAGAALVGSNIHVTSGAGAGRTLVLGGIQGRHATFQFGPTSGSLRDVTDRIQVGDMVRIDNSNFLAFETYYRHALLGPDVYVQNQFRRPDGSPIYPQRPVLMNDDFMVSTVGAPLSGDFNGKMIVLQYLLDWDGHPWFADWYRAKVRARQGNRYTDKYRLYFVDHATHGQEPDPTRTVRYWGALQQALRDVSAWAERGIAPLPETSYRVAEGQVLVPPTAAARKGIQPVVALTVNGRERTTVTVGQAVTFRGVAESPSGAGPIVSAEWDFAAGPKPTPGEANRYPVKETFTPANRVTFTETHVFEEPGIYFPALRVHAQRAGDAATPYARIGNLGRVRVVVREEGEMG